MSAVSSVFIKFDGERLIGIIADKCSGANFDEMPSSNVLEKSGTFGLVDWHRTGRRHSKETEEVFPLRDELAFERELYEVA